MGVDQLCGCRVELQVSSGGVSGKNLPLPPRNEESGSFLPQNRLVVAQGFALPAGAPDERELGDGGVDRLDRVRRPYPKAAL